MVEEDLAREVQRRNECWSEAVAVGSYPFVERVKRDLGIGVRHREITSAGEMFALREQRCAYLPDCDLENDVLRP